MPAVIPAIAAAAVSWGIGALIPAGIAPLLGSVAGLLVSTGLSLLLGAPKPSAKQQGADRFQTARTGVAPRNVVYGQAMVSGPLVYMSSSGDKKEWINVIVPVAGHRVQGFDAFWINGFRFPVTHIAAGGGGTTGAGWSGITGLHAAGTACIAKGTEEGALGTDRVIDASAGAFPGYAVGDSLILFRCYDGSQTDADASLIADAPDEWTTDHKLLGVAYIRLKVLYSRDIFPGGIQSVSAELRGKSDIYDPRDASTGYTTNSALCILDYLQGDHGLSVPDDEIDTDFWTAAANICDELVNLDSGGSTTQARYTLDGSFKLDVAPIGIMEELLTSCAGTLVYVAGAYRLYAGAYTAPSVSLSESDFAGPMRVTMQWRRAEQFNTITGNYQDPAQHYSAIAFPQVQSATQLADDGEEVKISTNFPFTINAARAQRLARLRLLVHRVAGLKVEATFKYGAIRVAVWDVVALTHADFGWSGEPFRVTSWKFDPVSGLVTITLQNEDSAAYAWTYSDAAEPVLSPTTALASPLAIPQLAAPTLTGSVTTSPDGTIVPQFLVEWTEPATPFQTATEIQWRSSVETDWTSSAVVEIPATEYTIKLADPGTRVSQTLNGWAWWGTRLGPNDAYRSVDVRVRAIASNVRGEWSVATTATMGRKTTGPANPNGAAVAAAVNGYRVSWTRPADTDLAAVEVWEDLGAGKVYVGESTGNGYQAKLGSADLAARTVYLIARNTSGYYPGDVNVVASGLYVNAGSVTPVAASTADIAAGAVTSFLDAKSTTPRVCSTTGWEDALTLDVTASAGDVVVVFWSAALTIFDDGSGSLVGGDSSRESGGSTG